MPIATIAMSLFIYLFISSLGQNTNTKKYKYRIQKKIPERIYGYGPASRLSLTHWLRIVIFYEHYVSPHLSQISLPGSRYCRTRTASAGTIQQLRR